MPEQQTAAPTPAPASGSTAAMFSSSTPSSASTPKPQQQQSAAGDTSEGFSGGNDADLEARPSGDGAEGFGDGTESSESTDSAPLVKASGDQWIDNRISELAAKRGVDPSNEGIYQLLFDLAKVEKRNADKDAHIQQLQSSADEWLTDWEKQQRQARQQPRQPFQQQQPAPVQQPVQPQQGVQAPGTYGDIGDSWRGPEDAFAAELAAYGDGTAPPDFRKLDEVRQAHFKRYGDHYIIPKVQRLVEQAIQQSFERAGLKQVVNTVQETIAHRQAEQIRVAAMEAVRSNPNIGPVLDTILKPEDGEVVIDGQRFPNSPLYRFLAENPEIRNYVDGVADSAHTTREQKQQAYIDAYRAAARWHIQQQKQGLTPEKAKQIHEAGKQQAEREQTRERVRQSVNAGSSRAPGAPSGKSYGQHLAGLNDTAGQSQKSLWGK